MNVGIAGTFSAISRHINALEKIQEIRIGGCWSMNGSQDSLMDQETGKICTDPECILEKADALIITEPGNFMNRLAILALRKARHVFIYPPVLRSSNEVYQLIKLAREANVILKCGRTGKTGINGLINSISDVKSISMVDFQHTIKIKEDNGTPDINEILLGDVEIINRLIQARNTFIKAKGLGVFTPKPEVINARLEFDNGSAVNYFCNKTGTQDEHNITVILKDSMLKYNLITNELSGWYLKRSINQKENPIFIENIQVEQTDYLFDDLRNFFSLIHSGPAFLSIYDNGFESFVLTDRILEKVSKTLVQFA
jgi:predicted dehydrogenase